MPISERFQDAGVPVLDFDVNQEGPLGSHWATIDELQERYSYFWTTYAYGHWVLTDPVAIREAFTDYNVFSSISEVAAEPNPSYTWIPANLDPPEHSRYRKPLNAWFARSAIEAVAPEMTRIARQTVESFAGRGECEFMTEFAAVYPSAVFLHSLGLPLEDTERFRNWVAGIFDNLRHPDLKDKLMEAMGGVRQYFAEALVDRRSQPRDPKTDFITYLIRSEVNGRPLTDEEILNIAVVLMVAGLHTTQGQLGYMFHFLAQHPEHRQRIIDEPDIVTPAVNEFLRVHTIVLTGRKVAKDIDFHGCPMKAGDMVMLALPAANRCPTEFPNPTEVDFDRGANQQIAFGYGAHRCLGSHLAQRELATALRVWHQLIPHYRLASDSQVMEVGGQLSPISFSLAWDPATVRPSG